jgi:hypothetical protein
MPAEAGRPVSVGGGPAAAEAGACDALLLSQFSMARAGAAIPRMAGRRVVTTPDSAVRRLRALLGA